MGSLFDPTIFKTNHLFLLRNNFAKWLFELNLLLLIASFFILALPFIIACKNKAREDFPVP